MARQQDGLTHAIRRLRRCKDLSSLVPKARGAGADTATTAPDLSCSSDYGAAADDDDEPID
eukprot:COSAG01_NODE_18761_length_1054_cov_2200.931937_1_plen_60_part_01